MSGFLLRGGVMVHGVDRLETRPLQAQRESTSTTKEVHHGQGWRLPVRCSRRPCAGHTGTIVSPSVPRNTRLSAPTVPLFEVQIDSPFVFSRGSPALAGACPRRWPSTRAKLGAQATGAAVSYTHLTLPTICSV